MSLDTRVWRDKRQEAYVVIKTKLAELETREKEIVKQLKKVDAAEGPLTLTRIA